MLIFLKRISYTDTYINAVNSKFQVIWMYISIRNEDNIAVVRFVSVEILKMVCLQ